MRRAALAVALVACGASAQPPRVTSVDVASATSGDDSTEVERVAMPAFAFPSLADPAVVYTPDRFAGRFVLIDFWASWCVPCHAEIPRIAAVHEAFGDRLDVLSVSLDLYPDDAEAFRQRVAPMPWLHGFVGEEFDHPSVAAFGVDRLPAAVLLGPDGTIRARGGALRRDLLWPTIERELGQERPDADAP
ncbi:TlpA family protein disulfide reductase [Rubrivirga marina]|uniref:Thioredoxin domain-containing protein n=1 Tax=Rubrivirga marina TaxID=1196024 RepID=A0A271J070_9BACT|nr:TlpA disulfide reductase family protein [Rubrivirga marina]PAP76901.1 hypothetical protein BSZ37_10900 [Rubrivirga marina]